MLLVATILACSILFSSCIGPFNLTNKLLTWNKEIDSKFVNELVFLSITPVYILTIITDLLVINSIEFWTGNNPVTDVGTIKTIKGNEGTYTVETKADGYTIQKEGEENVIELSFNKAEKTWSVEAGNESHKLITFTETGEVVMYLPDGSEMNVTLNEAGVLAFQQVAANYALYAAR